MRVQRKMPTLREFTVRQITRDELPRLHERRAELPVVAQIRDSHHRVARLVASGLRITEVAERSGYSYAFGSRRVNDPALRELVAHYRKMVDDAFVASQDEYHTLSTANMLAAERHIADHISDLDNKGELLPVRIALAISADKADRFGYGKKQTNLNVNVDFAKNLEGMLRRSGKTIDGTVVARQTLAGSPAGPSAEPQLPSAPSPAEAPQPLRRRAF